MGHTRLKGEEDMVNFVPRAQTTGSTLQHVPHGEPKKGKVGPYLFTRLLRQGNRSGYDVSCQDGIDR